MVLPLLENRY